ncbi:MAG: hypothetical protein CL607_06240 [Anaerolineaceae bacterium]|nr:hypothetical protein [Anaerolineaceae bacterium]
MKAETQQKMAQAMASGFGMPLEIALQPGTTLVEGEKKKADSWNTLFPVGEQVRLVLAPDLIQPVKDVLAALPAGHRLTVDDLKAAWGDNAIEVGTEEFYVLEEDGFKPFTPAEPAIARQLTADDQAAFEAFQAACPQVDVDTADVGLDHEAAFGVLDGERIVAVASGYEWIGCLDVGILTDPAYRGQGMGKAAVSACCAYFLPKERPVFYRHETDNVGSGKIAVALGYTHLATVYSFRRV